MTSRKVVVSFLGQFIGYVLSLAGLTILSRAIGPTLIGTVGYYVSFLGLFSILSDMGLSSAHTKRVSEGQDLGTAVGTYLSAKLVFAGLYMVVVLVVSYYIGYIDFTTAEHSTCSYVFLILLANVLLNNSIAAVVIGTFHARRETAKQYLISIIGRVAYLFCAIYVATVAPTLIGLALTYLVGGVFSVAMAIWLFRGMPICRPTWDMLKSYLSFGLPMLVAAIAGVIIINIDQVMIGTFLTDTEVGYYHISYKFSRALEFISVAVMGLLFPTLSARLSQNKREQLHATVDQALKYISLIYWPAMALVFVFAEPLMVIFFGKAFLPAAPVLRIIFLYSVFEATSRPGSALLLGSGHSRMYAIIATICVIVDLVCNLIFIPGQFLGIPMLGLGAVGAALSSVIVGFISNILLYLLLGRLLNYRLKVRFVYPLVVSAVLASPLYFGARSLHLLQRPAISQLGIIIGVSTIWGVIYLWFLHLVGEFGKTEGQFIKNAVGIRALNDYVREELFHRKSSR